MNFDFNGNPFGDSRVVTREQAYMAKIKLVCVDIFLANAPKKSEIDNMFEVCELDGIYKLQFVSLYFHGISFVPSSGGQQFKLQCDKL
jgi:hypothetical protein